MDPKLTRRAALKTGGAAALGAITSGQGVAAGGEVTGGPGAQTAPADRPAPKLSAYQFAQNIWIRIDGEAFCCYRGGKDQKYPYVYPIFGPATHLPMTDESAEPWPHHRSLFLGCDRVSGSNLWQEGVDRGQIYSIQLEIKSADDREVVLRDWCEWRSREGGLLIRDLRTCRVTAPDHSTRILDWTFELTARTDIWIGKTNHSLFAVRAAKELTPSGGGMLINSAGASGEKATFGEPAAWCGFTGTRFGQTESIVLMDSPKNPWYPCRWFTRDYGFASPTPFFWIDEQKPFQLAKDDTLNLCYRVVVMAGPIDRERLDQMHREWTPRA